MVRGMGSDRADPLHWVSPMDRADAARSLEVLGCKTMASLILTYRPHDARESKSRSDDRMLPLRHRASHPCAIATRVDCRRRCRQPRCARRSVAYVPSGTDASRPDRDGSSLRIDCDTDQPVRLSPSWSKWTPRHLGRPGHSRVNEDTVVASDDRSRPRACIVPFRGRDRGGLRGGRLILQGQ